MTSTKDPIPLLGNRTVKRYRVNLIGKIIIVYHYTEHLHAHLHLARN